MATYVFDLLGQEDMEGMLLEAHRVLSPGVVIAITGLTPGEAGVARWVSTVWSAAYRLRQGLTGGCRPLRLRDRLGPPLWKQRFSDVVVSFGIASEVVLAVRR